MTDTRTKPDKRRKAQGEVVTLPKCAYCGENAVASIGSCLRCGKRSLESRVVELEWQIRGLRESVEALERDSKDPVKHNIPIGGHR